MKKIRRTITMRKVEFTTIKKQQKRDADLEICPLCNNPISEKVLKETMDKNLTEIVEKNKV